MRFATALFQLANSMNLAPLLLALSSVVNSFAPEFEASQSEVRIKPVIGSCRLRKHKCRPVMSGQHHNIRTEKIKMVACLAKSCLVEPSQAGPLSAGNVPTIRTRCEQIPFSVETELIGNARLHYMS